MLTKKFFTGAVALGLLLGGFTVFKQASSSGTALASASTTDQISTTSTADPGDQIAEELQFFVDSNRKLKEQLATVKTMAIFSRPLRQGEKGADVQYLQQLLEQVVPTTTFPSYGYFGKTTVSAIQQFQKGVNLNPTGLADEETERILAEKVTENNPPDESREDRAQALLDSYDNAPAVSDSSSEPVAFDTSSLFFGGTAENKTSYPPTVSFVTSTDWSKFYVKIFNKIVTDIPVDTALDSIPDQPTLYRQTALYAYVLVNNSQLIRINQYNYAVDQFTHDGATFEDLSPNENMAAWTVADDNGKRVIIQNIFNNAELDFEIPAQFKQFGMVRFSPDGKKFAYSAATGNPQQENASIFVVDIMSGKRSRIANLKNQRNSYYIMDGWNGTQVKYEIKRIDELLQQN